MFGATATAVELAEAIRQRRVSSAELLDLYLDRITRLGPPVNAVVTLDTDRARDAAKRADVAIARGEPIGPLHGLPVTIKDAIETEGIRSTGGAVELTGHVPSADAPAVAALKRAGAIVFGKTNLPRWSSDMQTYNELFGTTNNPHSLDRIPGGSSGGAAAAVAAGFTAFELGTDIGGSIRNPAHFCGVYGLKPSFGLVPQRGYLDSPGGGGTDVDLNVFGPIARSADDLDLLIGVLCGPEPGRQHAWRVELPAPRFEKPSGLRVGVWFDEANAPLDREYRAALGRAADLLANAGATVDQAHPAVSFDEQVALFLAMVSAATALAQDPARAEAVAGGHLAWLRNERRRAALRATWTSWFESYDLLLCPVSTVPAFPHQQDGDPFTRKLEVNSDLRPYLEAPSWCGQISVTGHPAAVAPIGRTKAGLPVGVQCVTGFLRDREAVHAARIIGDLAGGYQPPPGFES